MTIAHNVIDYLQRNQLPYSVVAHAHSASSRQTSVAAHIPPEKLAKAVILNDKTGYVMAVIPASRYIDLTALSKRLGRPLELVAESGIPQIFQDCEPGAIPPIGPAYGMETVVDHGLVGQSDIYFEAGDHEELIHMDGEKFLLMLKQALHGTFAR